MVSTPHTHCTHTPHTPPRAPSQEEPASPAAAPAADGEAKSEKKKDKKEKKEKVGLIFSSTESARPDCLDSCCSAVLQPRFDGCRLCGDTQQGYSTGSLLCLPYPVM